jgi:starvation-inducible DNA-binding protein
MKTNIGIAQKNLVSVKDLLGSILADAVLLYTKTLKFHWNVSGKSFMELHKLFEGQYKKPEEAIDEIAERINKPGFKTPGTMAEFPEAASLKESPGKYPLQAAMIMELLKDHEAVVINLRKGIDDCDEKYGDKGTADFLTDLAQEHETLTWTLRRYLD